MIELLGSIGWGLLACGSITHVWHHARLRELLSLHLNHERVPALVLTTVELLLTIAIPVALLMGANDSGPGWLLGWLALAALIVAGGFMVWIGRLLVTGSDLPCACSFSSAPTSIWSFARSVCVGLVGLFAMADPSTSGTSVSTQIATLAVGWAIAAAVFVLPEAIVWPSASRALLARVDAHVSPT